MKILCKISVILVKTVIVTLLSVAAIIVLNYLISPVYRFPEPKAFSGEEIYDPYAGLALGGSNSADIQSVIADSISDTTNTYWKRANFHAHSRLKFNLTYGAKTPDEVVADYKSFDYDIIGVSNYQTITRYEPGDRNEYHIPLYEHGYNPLLFHQLVFGSNGESGWDILLPFNLSQRQFMLNHLIGRADEICFAHPYFTRKLNPDDMRYLSGYRLIEAESGMAESFNYWDAGLSSGKVSFIISGDDSHDTSRPHDIATHCTFIGCETTKYTDVLKALRAGCHYAMRIPNFGEGDWDIKRAENKKLPFVKNISFINDTIRVEVSRAAKMIFTGQDGVVKSEVINATEAYYCFTPNDTYIRASIEFDNGVKIHLNPYFRYSGDNPFYGEKPTVNIVATIGLDIVIVIMFTAILYLIVRVIRKRICYKKSDF